MGSGGREGSHKEHEGREGHKEELGGFCT